MKTVDETDFKWVGSESMNLYVDGIDQPPVPCIFILYDQGRKVAIKWRGSVYLTAKNLPGLHNQVAFATSLVDAWKCGVVIERRKIREYMSWCLALGLAVGGSIATIIIKGFAL